MRQLPIPASFWERLLRFIQPGTFGRIEMDVVDGKIVQLRLVETVKPVKSDEAGGMAA